MMTSSLRGDILIDCPAQHVWKCILEYPNWAPTVKSAELLSGEWDQEGGVALITKRDSASFFSMNLKMRPYKQIVRKIDTKNGDLQGFLDISLVEVNGKTRVTYSNYLTCQYETEMSLEDLQGEEAVVGIKESYLKPLKEYSEKTWK